MLKTAFIFGIVSLIPLLTSLFRFKVKESDNEAQVIIKKNMQQTQRIIAFIFAGAAIVLCILSVFIQEVKIADMVTLILYVGTLIASIGYAIIRQIQLQKTIRKLFKK